jgi:hypothetical protein
MKFNNSLVKKLVVETLEQTYTKSKLSWMDMMEELSKSIKKPVIIDDAGNYNVCECEPHHVSIRPIVHDIFDVETFKDGTDRHKKLYMKFENLKKYVSEFLSSDDKNYVDSTFERNVENSKDKEGGKKADKQSEKEENVVDPEKNNSLVKKPKVDSMNKEIDDPTQPMREVGKFEKQIDYKPKKPSYTPPTLPKNLQKLVVKYTKAGKTKKR